MSKVECISFLQRKLGIPKDFKKIFAKIWGASGMYTYETQCMIQFWNEMFAENSQDDNSTHSHSNFS